MENIVHKTVNEYEAFLSKHKLWDLIKDIDSQIEINSDNIDTLKSESKCLNDKLGKYYEYKAKAYQIRSRAEWVEKGEKSTSYFLRLEQQRQTYNRIVKLKTKDDK